MEAAALASSLLAAWREPGSSELLFKCLVVVVVCVEREGGGYRVAQCTWVLVRETH